jgi:hypothetical protein
MTELTETAQAPQTREEKWLARLDRYQAFVAEHGRRPGSAARDDAERSLGLWFREQLKDARGNKLSDTRRRCLDERFPGWFVPGGVNRRKAEARVQQLKDYRDAYGKWPSGRSTDPVVKSLAVWYYIQRDGVGAAATRVLLDAQVPGWNETVQETWERTAQEIAAFRARCAELPSRSSGDPRVRAWARWIDDMRRGRGMTPARTAHLDAVLPGWRIGKPKGRLPSQLEEARLAAEAQWTAKLRGYKAFMKERGRRPRCRAGDKAERSLAFWLQRQRELAAGRSGGLPEDRRLRLTGELPGWDAPGAGDEQSDAA